MIDLDLLIEVYLTMKEYVPSKDRQAASDQLMGCLSDSGLTVHDLKQFGGTDAFLSRSVKEYVDLSDDEAGPDDDYYNDDE